MPHPTAEKIVVRTNQSRKPLRDIPASVSVLSGEMLDKQPLGGVSEALSRVAGVAITSTGHGGGTQVAIRGVSANGALLAGASPIAYYLDSVPFGLVKSAIVPDMDAYDMDRVEVHRGPQGTLYGANELNGVARVLTHDADLSHYSFKARSHVSGTEGGGLGFGGDLAGNIPIIKDKLALRVVLGDDHIPGWIDQPLLGKKNANEGTSRSARVKLNARPTEHLKIGASVWLSGIKNGSTSYADNNNQQTTPIALPTYTDFEAYSGSIGYDFSRFTINSTTSYLHYMNHGYVDYHTITPGDDLLTAQSSKIFTEELSAASRGPSDWQWSAGAFYRNAKDVIYQTLQVLPAPINFGDISQSEAVYGEVTRFLLDRRLELSGGWRFFRDEVTQQERSPSSGNPHQPLAHRTQLFQAATPRASILYHINHSLNTYFSYSQGFRSGFNQNPLIMTEDPALPAVKGDTLSNYEVGLKGSAWRGLLDFDLAGYYIDWRDVQQNVDVPFHGAYLAATVNGGRASGFGVDASATVHLTDNFLIGGTFSWNDLQLDNSVMSSGVVLTPKGSRLNYSAQTTASAYVNYTFPVTNRGDTLVLSASMNYRSKEIARAIVSRSSMVYASNSPLTSRASIAYHSRQKWSVTIFGENLNNWNGLGQPPDVYYDYIRIRPRTIGMQVDVGL
ncbi:TonB-dependent receptor [Komagataeibacter swingsii DSM 16373]|nr:TonB-dependent receptor [Komagataeibacter swingsii DSM 16373]